MIKNWLEFIKESSSFGQHHKLENKTVKSFFYDLLDHRFIIGTDLRYILKSGYSRIKDSKKSKAIVFHSPYFVRFWEELDDTPILTGDEVHPCYVINIDTYQTRDYRGKFDPYLKDALLTGLEMIKDYAECEVFVVFEDYRSVVLKNDDVNYLGISYNGNAGFLFDLYGSPFDDGESSLESREITIFAVQKNTIKLTETDLYYYFDYDSQKDVVLEDGKIYLKIDEYELASNLLKNDFQKEVISYGVEFLDERYHSSDFRPDNYYLVEYILDNDNLSLLIKKIISLKGIENLVDELVNLNLKIDYLKEKNEEQIIDYLLNEKGKKTLIKLIESDFLNGREKEFIDDIKNEYSYIACDNFISSVYKETVKSFDSLIEEHFIFKKEINDEDDKTYYYLRYNDVWLSETEGGKLFRCWEAYCYTNGIYNLTLDVKEVTDYDVNLIQFNKEIQQHLK